MKYNFNLKFTSPINPVLKPDLRGRIMDNEHYYDIYVQGVDELKSLKPTKIATVKGIPEKTKWLRAGDEGRIRYKKTADGKKWSGIIYDNFEQAEKAREIDPKIKALPFG